MDFTSTLLSAVKATLPPSEITAWSQNPDVLWMVVVGFLLAFILAFAVGANDVANSFGTSVGSKVLTLKQACIYAVIFETLGAVLIGGRVSDTIWKEIVDLDQFHGREKMLMLGEISALIGAAVWLMIATFMKIPVSGTHSIVGATMGFALVRMGGTGIQWIPIGKIVASWFISPVLAGLMSSFFFLIIRHFILRRKDHLGPALHAMPAFYSLAIFVNCLSIFLGGSELLRFNEIPWWGALILSLGIGLLTAVMVQLVMVPWQRNRILAMTAQLQLKQQNGELDSNMATATQTPSPSLGGSTLDLKKQHALRKQHREISTSTSDGLVASFINGNGRTSRGTGMMSASTSMTGLTMSRVQSFIMKHADQRELGSVKEVDHSEELDAAKEDPNTPGHTQVLLLPRLKPELPKIEDKESDLFIRRNSLDETKRHLGDEETNHAHPAEVVNVNLRADSTSPAQTDIAVDVTAAEPGAVELGLSMDATPKKEGRWWKKKRPHHRHQHHHHEHENGQKPAHHRHRHRSGSHHRVRDPPEVQAVFSYLQILVAAFTAFAHGGNDVCNAIGPLIALWEVYTKGVIPEKSDTAFYILAFGGLGISVGLSILGRKVIETVGTNLTPVIPSSGFCIGLGTACTVLIASKIGLPISTTHCIVGSVVAVGWLRSQSQVNWKLFSTILFGWFVTVPVTVGLSAASMAILQVVA